MIALVDYDLGNLRSVEKALATVGADVRLTSDPDVILAADKVVLPGVGAFGDGMANLRRRGLDEVVLEVVARGTPLLGICVGMQWLYEGSTEAPECPGLGVIEGRCTRLTGGRDQLKVPHVGWNTLNLTKDSRLLEGLGGESNVYFTHSFAGPVGNATAASTEYGGEQFAAAVEDGLIMGVQFHPEKSSEVGLAILRNFLRLVSRTTQVAR